MLAADAATASSGWDTAAVTSVVVGALALIGVFATNLVALVTGRGTTRQAAENSRRERWWERAQWAMERAYDGDPLTRAVGLTVLESLGDSDLADAAEQAMLARVAIAVLTGGAP
jgi:hypothetical protein